MQQPLGLLKHFLYSFTYLHTHLFILPYSKNGHPIKSLFAAIISADLFANLVAGLGVAWSLQEYKYRVRRCQMELLMHLICSISCLHFQFKIFCTMIAEFGKKCQAMNSAASLSGHFYLKKSRHRNRGPIIGLSPTLFVPMEIFHIRWLLD